MLSSWIQTHEMQKEEWAVGESILGVFLGSDFLEIYRF
jgi:hypothetical protein